MANGIGSTQLVEALSRAGMLGFFGSAGLTVNDVARAVDRLGDTLGPGAYGFNLIHSPNEPGLEAEVVELYLRRGVRLVEASAYLDLTLPVVRYRVAGIRRDASGKIVAPNRVIAKVSRVEVARKFMSPPPQAMLQQMVGQGHITPEQATLARQIPVAQDITAEADSAGHTDNRPAVALIPTMTALRSQLQREFAYEVPIRVGAAGGISTPASAAAAFSMGAAYIVTGSVNQACVESGSSDVVREMLAQAEQADIMMAPAADMFEMGVKLQVLKRGTMFAMRASKLWEIYRSRGSLEEIPASERTQLEKTIFRRPLDQVWEETAAFFRERDPAQVERAERDPRHRMALVFRWYLGLSSQWANTGDPDRRMDYQIWCGPAMGAFNEWVKGSFLEHAGNRQAVVVALNILYGAAVLLRSQMLRFQGVTFPPGIPDFAPLPLAELHRRLNPSRPNA
jgi:PfaD family protein